MGTYSVKATSGTSTFYLNQQIQAEKGIDYWKGRVVTLSQWVKTSESSLVRIGLQDNANHFSSYHTGGGDWELLSVTITVNASATTLTGTCGFIDSSTGKVAYFDGAMLVEGASQFAFSPKPAKENHKVDYSASTNLTGWSDVTTNDVWYHDVGNMRFISFAISGTSNTTTAQLTVPIAGINASNIGFTGYMVDNGTPLTAPGRVDLNETTGVISVYKDMYVGSWTNSGTKIVYGQFFYEAA